MTGALPTVRLLGAGLLILQAGCSGGGTVNDLFMALDPAGDRQRTEFFTDTENIFCVAKVTGASNGTTINARIRLVEFAGQPHDILLALGEDVVTGPDMVSAFELLKPPDTPNAPWPVGKFACDIQLDGVGAASTTFQILMPACPLYAVSAGITCAGYYPVGARCPAVDQTQTCTCDASGSWTC